MLRRSVLVPLAVLLASVGVMAGPTEAKAVPEFNHGVRASAGDGETRFWLRLGDLHEGRVKMVQINGYDAQKRSDGVWVATFPTPAKRFKNTLLTEVVTSKETYGSWVHFKMVLR